MGIVKSLHLLQEVFFCPKKIFPVTRSISPAKGNIFPVTHGKDMNILQRTWLLLLLIMMLNKEGLLTLLDPNNL